MVVVKIKIPKSEYEFLKAYSSLTGQKVTEYIEELVIFTVRYSQEFIKEQRKKGAMSPKAFFELQKAKSKFKDIVV